jgi:CHAT domain-containing protein/tetratricopeptide (TPR) repeat protein
MVDAKAASKPDPFDHLAALPDDAGRRAFLSRHPSLISSSTVRQLDEAVGVFLRQDLQKAKSLAAAALIISEKLGDKEARAFALRAQGNASWFLGDNKQAAELHAEAVQLFSNAGNRVEEGRTRSVSIQPLILLGEYDRALQSSEKARQIFTAAGESIRLARLEINVGNIFHRQDRFREALDCYERAYRELQPDKDAEGIVAALHNMAICRISLNEYVEALDAYEQARAIGAAKNMPLAVAQADYNIAYLHYSRGDYARALSMLRPAREACEKAGDAYHAALCHLDLSEIYVELNMGPEAMAMAEEASLRFRKLGMGYETAKALSFLAIALGQQGKGTKALACFEQAREMFVKEQNQVWPSLIDLYKAVLYFNTARFIEARTYCEAAHQFFRTSPLPGKAIVCRLLLARLSLEAGNIDAARSECATAYHDLESIDAPILRYQANLIMGQIEEASGNIEAAEGLYRIAKEILEGLRTDLHVEELKISFMKNRLAVYENLVGLCLVSKSTAIAREEAWTYMEQAKSRALLDIISDRMTPVTLDEALDAEAAGRVRSLREQLNWYYHRIEIEQLGQTPSSPDRLIDLQQQAQIREKELLQVIREMPSSEDSVTAAAPARVASLQTIRDCLQQETTLLEFFRIQDYILATTVTKDSIEIIRVARVRRVARILRMLRFQLSKFRLGSIYARKFQDELLRTIQAHLADLYSELLRPIKDKFHGRHLVVVPHELLHSVPFHALYDGKQYLIDSFTVSYAPSASIYAQCCRKQANIGGPSLILGLPDSQMPSILEELESVATILPESESFLGLAASEKTLREKGPRSRLIHIATHGFFRQDAPLFSGIRLADTFLTLHDLHGLKLPVDQVTLSGCSTGASVVAAGDELIGLVRGLLSAGARSLLLTLWDVSDSSTAEFMKSFYTFVSQKRDRASALQKAMQDLRERYPHPFYWAPFFLVGKVFSE